MFQVNGSAKALVVKQAPVALVKANRISTKSKTPTGTSTLPPIPSTKCDVRDKLVSGRKKPKRAVPSATKKVVKVLTLIEEAEALLQKAPSEIPGTCGTARILFNHYNKLFPVYNGVLKWQDVDDEYCLSFVYRGNYKRDIIPEELYNSEQPEANRVRRDDVGIYFLGVVAGSSYRLQVEEDPEAGIGANGMRLIDGPIRAVQDHAKLECPLKSGNAAVKDITQTLRNMQASELQTDEAKNLRELRDLEDILYSGG